MSESRDRRIETGRAPALRDQKAKEHADGADALSRRRPSGLLALIQHELSQVPRVIHARLFAELLDERTQLEPVDGKSRIGGPALLTHPVAEGHQHRCLDRWFNKGWSRDNSSAPQIDKPKIDTVLLPVRFQLWMMSSTTASFQVIEELLCISFFNARDRQVSMGDPMEKVFRCPNVLARCNPLIATSGQFLGESFKQMTAGATAQLLDT
jgi:hypothetical protein